MVLEEIESAVATLDASFCLGEKITNQNKLADETEKQIDILWDFEEQISYFYSLDYEKMTEHLVSYYFERSANMYYRAKHEGNNKKHIKIIKEHKKHIEKTYSKYIHLDTEKKLYIYKKTNPFMFFVMRIKRKHI